MKERFGITPGVFLQLLVFILIVPCLPLLISGRWGWVEAWLYAGLNILGFVLSRRVVARRNPALIAERAQFIRHADVPQWDKVLARVVGMGSGLILVVVGLDARFGWSPGVPLWLKVLAGVVLLVGYLVASAALVANPFFSAMVRLQRERGHHVIRTGVYRWLRHPGYAGGLYLYLATPLFLDAWWAFVPALLFSLALILRTALEDRWLSENLPGYREYASRVRYRLFPFVW